ncbi:hypothetical protein RRG08_064157 [Elysia crispata]|uniref:Uncharacterized protein n=1 Tax=Elysia crispata TaxID=231223 RepID=A0AAE0ZLZ1_9GAST|nr:hypothetical protein RRG08_064157 [Elysia crispata]
MVTILLLSVAVLTLSGSMWTARDVTVATPLPTSGGQHLFRGANSMLGLQLASHRVQTTKYGATQWSSEDHGGSSVKEMSRFSSDRLPLPLKMYQTGLMQNVRGRISRLPDRDQDNIITFGDSKLDGFVPEPSDVDGNKQTIQEEASEESQSPLKGIL